MTKTDPKVMLRGHEIHTDAEGRMLLSDLHRAVKDQPKPCKMCDWLLNSRTVNLVVRLGPQSVGSVDKGSTALPRGTYVAMELAYDFVMWNVPDLRVKMIQEYNASHLEFKPQ